jgi:D-glycero-alpha-D-manno-heptose-7-phosphate kinase
MHDKTASGVKHPGSLTAPRRAVTATAPVRVVDLGGWTDTWFAGSGLVCCVAVGPATTVSISLPENVDASDESSSKPISWNTPDLPGTTEHPLLQAVAKQYELPGAEVTVRSAVPPGAGLGTSASVLVALTAAMDAATQALAPESDPNWRQPAWLAAQAHRAETSTGAQSGVQDQCAAAHGGVLLIDVSYPSTSVSQVELPVVIAAELGERLLTVSFGMPHQSSDLHRQVIGHLEGRDCSRKMAPLRQAAADGAAALTKGDFDGYAEAIRANTAAQRALHPALIGSDAQQLMSVAARCGAVVKVNGAGGEGGSATVLLPADPALRGRLLNAVETHARWKVLDLRPTFVGTTVTAEPRLS